jgi:uncharacterized damage-inducible protein DinB
MISIELSLKHMAWANDRLFRQVAALPEECLRATYGPSDWTVADIILHIVEGDEWYRFLLNGQQGSEHKRPENAADVLELLTYLNPFEEMYLTEAKRDDAEVEFQDGDHLVRATRSMLIHQAVYHATEHRAHIATAIEVQGIAKISLDALDHWNFLGTKND